MIIQPHVPKPCSENWEKMKIGLGSRFCENCKKDVKDFTKMSRNEILSYLFSNHDKQICGRFKKEQLDFTYSDLLVSIHALSKRPRNSNAAFYLLTMGALLLSGCGEDTQKGNPPSTISVDWNGCKTIDSASIKTDNEIQGKIVVPPEQVMMLGQPVIFRDDTLGKQACLIADTMPEFYGGMDSLITYIQHELDYPKWEMENGIEGVVYVTFIIDKNGNIKDAKISKGVTDARNFESEVLKLVNEMPAWKPGILNGKRVDVQFHLPVKFKL